MLPALPLRLSIVATHTAAVEILIFLICSSISDIKVEECDATGDAQSVAAGSIKKLCNNAKLLRSAPNCTILEPLYT